MVKEKEEFLRYVIKVVLFRDTCQSCTHTHLMWLSRFCILLLEAYNCFNQLFLHCLIDIACCYNSSIHEKAKLLIVYNKLLLKKEIEQNKTDINVEQGW